MTKETKQAAIRNNTQIESITATIEDENTISISAMDYKEFKAKTAEIDLTEIYVVAIVNRQGHRYDFGGICDNRAFFSRNLNA